jgi:biopolymer transport protein TolQ
MIILTTLLKSGVGDILVNAGIVAKIVLGILTLLSAVSWAIAIDKLKSFRRLENLSRRLLLRIPGDFSIFDSERYTGESTDSNLSHLLTEAARSVERDLASLRTVRESHAHTIAQSCRQAMERAALRRIDRMEHNLNILATTASVSPFLGLFGTVWGVMNSFLSMGQMGSASLTVVGSGVAEALITTVFGLGAAIPALVAYNYLVNFIRREQSQMESFISRVSESVEKEILRELDSAKVSV